LIPAGPAANRYGPSPRERAVSALLSLAICLMLGFMLVRMGAFAPTAPGNGSRLVAVDVTNHEADKPRQAQRTPAHLVAAASASAPVVTPPLPVPTESPLPALNLIPLTREQMASADIGRMPRRGPAAGPPAPQGGAEAAGGGDGPGGAHLYAAEWVREPTNAEMATYIPRGANTPGAWAMIACRTVDRFRVEDCREMAESPPGSGLARGLRQASWQFLVRPPRVNGQPLVGSWVRIRFDFTRKSDESGDGGNSG
jgi:protein TonB